ASADIECESDMQNCQFVGNNPTVNSNTGFNRYLVRARQFST
ncbi:hypothetical protein MGSAQ_003141, partial [marine sediment metagenome]